MREDGWGPVEKIGKMRKMKEITAYESRQLKNLEPSELFGRRTYNCEVEVNLGTRAAVVVVDFNASKTRYKPGGHRKDTDGEDEGD